jgi:hypothetical protein
MKKFNVLFIVFILSFSFVNSYDIKENFNSVFATVTGCACGSSFYQCGYFISNSSNNKWFYSNIPTGGCGSSCSTPLTILNFSNSNAVKLIGVTGISGCIASININLSGYSITPNTKISIRSLNNALAGFAYTQANNVGSIFLYKNETNNGCLMGIKTSYNSLSACINSCQLYPKQGNTYSSFDMLDIMTNCSMSIQDLLSIKYIGLATNTYNSAGTSFEFSIDEFNITGLQDITSNSLPVLTVEKNNTVCFNKNESGIRYYFNYTCIDNESDACYYKQYDSSIYNLIFKETFEDADTIIKYGSGTNIFDFQPFSSDIPVNSKPKSNFFDNISFVTNCNTANSIFDNPNMAIGKVYNDNGYSLFNDGCAQNSYFVFPQSNVNDMGEKILSFQYILTGDTFYNEIAWNDFYLSDINKNNIVNISIYRNYSNNNNKIWVGNIKVYDGISEELPTPNLYVFQPIIVLNYSGNNYYVNFMYYNYTTQTYDSLNRTSTYPLYNTNIKYLKIIPYVQNKYYYDKFIYISNTLFQNWNTNLNNYYDINTTGAFKYNIYYSDSLHYLTEYKDYTLNFAVYSCDSYIDTNKYLSPTYKDIAKNTKLLTASMCNLADTLGNGFKPLPSSDGINSYILNTCAVTRNVLFILSFIISIGIVIFIRGFAFIPSDILIGIMAINQLIILILFSMFFIDFTITQMIISGLVFALGVGLIVRYVIFPSNTGMQQ